METHLTIKHLAGYLPYGLRGFCHTGYNGGLDVKQEVIGLGESYITYRNTCFQCVDVQLSEFKPILHPLSDLTKEIEVNREKFVPIEYNAFKHDKENIVEFQNKFIHYKSLKFGIIERLLEWHFDIHGLIEKGLAIDINTLKL